MSLKIVIFGLSITSSWGNGHATTYRALVKALAARGHQVSFLERDVPWYRGHRDLPNPPYCKTELYSSLKEVPLRFGGLVADAHLVIMGSYVPDGAVLGDWITSHARNVTAFYDIDTPVTLEKLASGNADYIAPTLIPRFDLYLSFSGGPILTRIEEMYGSRRAVALYCAVDPEIHVPANVPVTTALGYLGTYSPDRQPAVERLLLEPARQLPEHSFAVAGPQYPAGLEWPSNVVHTEHLPPASHPAFYCSQSYTLNVTRSDMIANGFSPSVRLFEAAACGTPIISDRWAGLETVFAPGKEILIADNSAEVIRFLMEIPEDRRRALAEAARNCVLRNHTAMHRAAQLETYYAQTKEEKWPRRHVEAVA